MKDVCMIPAYNRPEFLYLCLEQIRKADGWKELKYLFCLDRGYTVNVKTIAKTIGADYEIIETPLTQYTIGKQSYNVLNGYKEAAVMSGKYVYMIEDDVMVGRDFFNWHKQVHDNALLFCSIASKNNNRKIEEEGNEREYYLTKDDFQSLGVCFDKKIIFDTIVEHIRHDYFANPVQYCRDNFPNSSIGAAFAEQDGLIRRIQMKDGRPIAFPYIPRCYHAGFYGKNRGRYASGDFGNRLQKVRNTIFNRAMMKEANKQNEDFYRDSEPIDLNVTTSEKLIFKSIYK